MNHRPVVIAHRGASGYLPEHTLPAKALAHGMGADYLEQDVVASRDGQLIVFHDLYLDAMTDVGPRFPGRARADGLHYCIDFTMAELRNLRVTERRGRDGRARFPGRFPVEKGTFGIHTLEEELDLIQGLNRSTGRNAGVYAEVKDPAWHRQHDMDLGRKLLEVLGAFGYRTRVDTCFVQCFDPAELQRLRQELRTELPLIRLLDSGTAIDCQQLTAIAAHAEGIGPALELVTHSVTAIARELGLLVHPYTFRADQLPSEFASFEALLTRFVEELEVDGLFTDHPDRVVKWLGAQRAVPTPSASNTP